MRNAIYHYDHGDVVPVPTQKDNQPTPYLKKIASLLQNNRTTMDQLARTPVTPQDLLANAIVTPVG